MPLAGLIAGLAGAGLDFGLGLYQTNKTNALNEHMNERQLQVAQQMQQRNFDYQREMFDRENAYNSPENQYQLYQRAGINPLMAMSQGQSFQAASAGSGDSGSVPSMTPMQAYQPSLGRDIGSAIDTYFRGRLQQEQAANISADTDYKVASMQQRILKDYYDVMNSDLDAHTKRIVAYQYQRQLDFFNDTYQARQHQVNNDANVAFENAQRLERENFEATITQSVRLAVTESGLRISWQQEKNLAGQLALIHQQAQTEHWTQQKLKAEERRVIQDLHINAPEEYRSNYEMGLYNSKVGNVENFLDRFNRNMERLNPLKGLFGKSSGK